MIPLPIAEVRSALDETRRRLDARAPSSREAGRLSRMLARITTRLSTPPRVVLLGEFNSGKSTLANALIGAEALPTSIHANTRVPLHARFAEIPALSIERFDGTRAPLDANALVDLQSGNVRMLHVAMPLERLATFELIDTPGLASGSSRPDSHAEDACRRAHVAIWCTASTQAWKATEAATWSALPPRLRPRSMLVATLADALNTDRDRMRLETRLKAEAGQQFAEVVMVSAADVDELRRNPVPPNEAGNRRELWAERWQSSGGAALDAALQRLLDAEWSDRSLSVERALTRTASRLAAQQTSPATAPLAVIQRGRSPFTEKSH